MRHHGVLHSRTSHGIDRRSTASETERLTKFHTVPPIARPSDTARLQCALWPLLSSVLSSDLQLYSIWFSPSIYSLAAPLLPRSHRRHVPPFSPHTLRFLAPPYSLFHSPISPPMLLPLFATLTVAIAVGLHFYPPTDFLYHHPIFTHVFPASPSPFTLLEQVRVYSAEDEGEFVGKASKHSPSLTIQNGGWGLVKIVVPHPDEDDHFISSIWLRDSDSGDLVASSSIRGNTATFHTASWMQKRGGQRANLVAYANCNKHGTWRSSTETASGRN